MQQKARTPTLMDFRPIQGEEFRIPLTKERSSPQRIHWSDRRRSLLTSVFNIWQVEVRFPSSQVSS